jgi:hypothetical protein
LTFLHVRTSGNADLVSMQFVHVTNLGVTSSCPPPPPLPPYGEYSKKMEEGVHGELVHKVEEELVARPQRRSIWYVYIHMYM